MKYHMDYYKILEVNPDATQAEIRRAYRCLALKNHPDRNPGAQSTALMQEINEAYDVIGNQNKRKKYDAERSVPPPPRQKTYASRQSAPPPPRQKTHASGQSSPPKQTRYDSARPTPPPSRRAESAARPVTDPFILTVRQQLFAQSFRIVLIIALLFTLTVDIIAVRILSIWETGIYLAFLFALTLNAIATYGVLLFREFFLTIKSESRCPKCSQMWASEKLEEQMLGFFDLIESNDDKWGQINWEKKSMPRHKCVRCGYEWEAVKAKKQRVPPPR